MSIKYAITGNIASGKSQVEKMLINCGFSVYDSDIITHEILDELNEFHEYDVFTNGKIDRKKLGRLVFSNPQIKKQLEQFIHPVIKSKILDLFKKHKDDKYIFVSVPLLYEAGFEDIFDKVLLICIDEEIQLNRLMDRNHYTKEEAIVRINSQIPQADKINKADYVIYNNSSVKELEQQVKLFIEKL